jgi:hypothetical protein
MRQYKTGYFAILILSSIFFMTGCATQVVEVPAQIKPSKVKLSQYKEVILVKAEIAPTYAKHPANIKAANKIDEILHQKLSAFYSNIQKKSVAEAKLLTASNDKVLVIKPKIKQIKFIGGAARFWAGAMAGSSVVIMDTAFIDLTTGEELANPGYLRKAGAYTDPFGIGSNDMLEQVAADVANYVAMSQ